MRGLLTLMAALLATAPPALSPAAAQNVPPEDAEVILAVQRFVAAIGSEDKTAIAQHLMRDGMIFVHNQMDPDNPRLTIVPAADHIDRWATGTRAVSEVMSMDIVVVEEDMAHVIGPYTFRVGDEISHCGVNSLSLVKTAEGWRIGNTSFTMVPPQQCADVGAPEVPEEQAE